MGIFFAFDDNRVNFDDPRLMIKDKYHHIFARKELTSFILSEICALDMLYAVTIMNEGYYADRLSLKGGLSVRSLVPLKTHRFSFDADFDPNTHCGFTYRDVCRLKLDLEKHGSERKCKTRVRKTKDDDRLYFIEIEYRKPLKDLGCSIIEPPKIEVCKTCRVHEKPIKTEINTFIDLKMMGLKPLEIVHLNPEEQFATKLYVIGSSGRQRNHYDVYDVFGIYNNVDLDIKKAKNIFNTLCQKHGSTPDKHIIECRHQLDAMFKNNKKKIRLTETMFEQKNFSFEEMISQTKSFYDFEVKGRS